VRREISSSAEQLLSTSIGRVFLKGQSNNLVQKSHMQAEHPTFRQSQSRADKKQAESAQDNPPELTFRFYMLKH
jgi:hypothetical protein